MGGGIRIVIPRTVHDLNDNEFRVEEVNGRIRFTHLSAVVAGSVNPRVMEFDPNTTRAIERAIGEAREAAKAHFIAKYRCPVCGGFDFDAEGNPEVCPGPPREEPDWEQL